MGSGDSDHSFFNQVVQGANAGVKFVSGYDAKTGEWSTHGSHFQPLDEGIGAIDGRNASRAALNQAQDQFNQQRADAQKLLEQQQWNRMNSDVTASSTAAGARTAGFGPSYATSTPQALGTGAKNNSGKDFLGL